MCSPAFIDAGSIQRVPYKKAHLSTLYLQWSLFTSEIFIKNAVFQYTTFCKKPLYKQLNAVEPKI